MQPKKSAWHQANEQRSKPTSRGQKGSIIFGPCSRVSRDPSPWAWKRLTRLVTVRANSTEYVLRTLLGIQAANPLNRKGQKHALSESSPVPACPSREAGPMDSGWITNGDDGEWENPWSEPTDNPLICAFDFDCLARCARESCHVLYDATVLRTRHSSTTGEDNGSHDAKYSMQEPILRGRLLHSTSRRDSAIRLGLQVRRTTCHVNNWNYHINQRAKDCDYSVSNPFQLSVHIDRNTGTVLWYSVLYQETEVVLAQGNC